MQHYISFVGKQTLQLAITTASLKRARHPRSYISFSLPSLVSSAVSKTPIACWVGYMHRKICWRVQGFGRTRLRQEVSGAISLRETPEECTVKQIQRWLLSRLYYLLFVSGPKSVSQLLSYSKEISMAGNEQSKPL